MREDDGVSPGGGSEKLRGLTFAKQFPNPAEPLRGLFVADQVRATKDAVEWTVVAPVPYVPKWLAALLGKPYVKGAGSIGGIDVIRPRYPVLPRRLLYTTVAPAIARFARRAVGRLLRDWRPDFVHVHGLYPSGAAAARLFWATGVPIVMTVHGSDLYTNLEPPSWRRELLRAVDTADKILCVGRRLAEDVERELDVDSARIQVIPDAYDEDLYSWIDRPKSDGPIRLVSVGRLVPVKGHDVLVRAFARAVARGLDATLAIVGQGPEREALRRLAGELGVGDRVVLAGALGGDELRARLVAADAFVSASRSEGFGVAIIEALGTGLPVLATRSGGPEDIVGVGDGMLVPVGDVDAMALGLEELASRLDAFDSRAISNRAAERFGSRVVGERLLAVYRDAVEQAHG